VKEQGAAGVWEGQIAEFIEDHRIGAGKGRIDGSMGEMGLDIERAEFIRAVWDSFLAWA